ncbi:uncharacterized protein LOC143912589 [Arctopsyche grandis]|uniref:uncharacterized protein LOC143912589 n=1 Tax=Arctopsyche grandis TaxID=121162 RepID=UPI00406D86F7
MGRRNTARRRLAGAGTGTGLAAGSSEPNLEIGGPTIGFPPGTTVDELRLFSRRKATNASYNQDNLFLESGSLKDITSEYTRCYRAPPLATYSLGDLTDPANEPKSITTMRRFSSQSEDMINKFRNSEPGLGNNRWHRPSKEQNLKLEGTRL